MINLAEAEQLGILTHDAVVRLWDRMYKDNLYLPETAYEEYVIKKKVI